MKLKDINGTVINTEKLSILNPSALDVSRKCMTLVLDTLRYAFYYLKEEDMRADYEALYSKLESKWFIHLLLIF